MLRTVILVALLLPACGPGAGGTPPASDPIPPADGVELCESFTAHSTGCAWNGNVNELDWNCGEAALVWTEAAFRAFTACATALACDDMGATCLSEAHDAVTPQTIHEQYGARCDQRFTECELGALLQLCATSTYELYATPSVEVLIACFDEPCDGIQACLEDAL